ncbi:MAG: ankyrin repeat domain-containing protein [Spirochaetes bacterium]|nr:ankyrin repeat domain-containing protein [Spirochaetota bacterium]
MDILDNIITAASSGELEKLKALLEKYPDMVDKSNSAGLTPLAGALVNKRLEETEYLLIKNADKRSCMENGQPALDWAREQDNNDAAFFLIAWDYLDRLYAAAAIWKKHKIKEAYCDICLARMTEEDSTMLSVDEAFMAENYSNKVVEQVRKQKPSLFKDKTPKEAVEIVKDQIKKSAPTGRYFVCEDCVETYYLQIVFGKDRDKVFEIVNRIFEESN